MSEFLCQIPENIQDHVKQITKTSGLPNTEESVEKIAEGWLEKKKVIEEKINDMNMEEVELFEKDDENGAIAMTYSGSIISIGPIMNDARKVEYSSIGLRQDVPDMVSNDNTKLSNDIIIDKNIEFINGPVKKTSPIYKILICKEPLTLEEQEEKIKEVSTMIIDDFVEVNKTIMLEN